MKRREDEARYLDDCVKVEPVALEDEFIRLPGDLAYWSERYADAYEMFLDAKLVRERVYAELTMKHRDRLSLTSKGRVTVGEIEAAVILDADYLEAKTNENAAESNKIRMHGIVEALRAKRDMLISVGAHQRAEMDHDPSIRVRRAEASWPTGG